MLQEGGYFVAALGENVRQWLRGLQGRDADPGRSAGQRSPVAQGSACSDRPFLRDIRRFETDTDDEGRRDPRSWFVRRPGRLIHIGDALDGRPPSVVLGLAALVLVFISVADRASGPKVSLSLFYLVPATLVTWRLGRGWGSFAALASALAWLTADLASGLYPEQSVIPYWNVAVRFVVLIIVVFLLSGFRGSLEREREVAAREIEAAERAREMSLLKDTLLHAVSHDLKGPITAVLGTASTLRRAGELGLTQEQIASLLDGVQSSGRRMYRLVEDLLDLERLEQRLLDPVREPVDVGALARRIVGEAEYLADHPVRVLAPPGTVRVDGAQVERIIENLLRNAARHTPAGTPVLVRVDPTPDGCSLQVEDEGPGIPAELRESLFEPFRQGEDARRSGSGAGIGLSLVARFAELHGGAARVEDRPGGGARFVVLLPSGAEPSMLVGSPSIAAASRR